MNLMYGAPPSGKKNDRESKEAVERLRQAMENLPKGNPKSDPVVPGFTWRGSAFVWVGNSRFEAGCEDWSAAVWPLGLKWRTDIRVAGGHRDGTGDTPQEALEDAVRGWVLAVGKLLE